MLILEDTVDQQVTIAVFILIFADVVYGLSHIIVYSFLLLSVVDANEIKANRAIPKHKAC